MEGTKSKSGTIAPGRLLSVALMLFCLTFLTSLNFFRYSSTEDLKTSVFGQNTEEKNSDIPPSGPTEEKSSTGSSLSFVEEILHEVHPEYNFDASNQFYLHHIAEAEKIEMFHPERVLPPPKF